jgi:hypothetical protein
MPDTSKEFTLAERAILRNQRLIMLALVAMGHEMKLGNSKHIGELRFRVGEMDRYWEFIAAPNDRLVPYDPDHKG